MPLRGVFDVVAFVSEPDSIISPSEGVDGDFNLWDAMVYSSLLEETKKNYFKIPKEKKTPARLARAFTITSRGWCIEKVQPARKGLPFDSTQP